MHIDWNSLGKVAMISITIAVSIVIIFSLGVLALSHHDTNTDHNGHATLALTGAILCFTTCATVVLYSIYLIIPQLHH
ncbi:MAG: hypothetical protein JO115_01475 [Pseudonocardiales bacterium]|nr:hypothetical protein [Pseudonocardiales bacterium]